MSQGERRQSCPFGDFYPLVAWVDPKNISSPFCASLMVSSVGEVGEGPTCIIVELSTNQYPTSLMFSLEIHHLNTAPCPTFLIQSSNGVLKVS